MAEKAWRPFSSTVSQSSWTDSEGPAEVSKPEWPRTAAPDRSPGGQLKPDSYSVFLDAAFWHVDDVAKLKSGE